jgi:hypothetical protein
VFLVMYELDLYIYEVKSALACKCDICDIIIDRTLQLRSITPAFYSGGHPIIPRSVEQLSGLRFQWFYSAPSGNCRDATFN